MKSKKEIYGYDRMDLRIAYRDYKKASRLLDIVLVLGFCGVIGYLAYTVLW